MILGKQMTSIVIKKQIDCAIIPEPVLTHYEKLKDKTTEPKSWVEVSEEQMWEELCFCILSANVSYDLVKSCISVLQDRGYLDIKQLISNKNSKKDLFNILNMPTFQPKKKDGTLRKYRYPKVRSEQIIKAAHFIYSENKSIKEILNKFESDIDARNYLALNISGLGIKEASHFLRNIHYSDSLAILDIHMLEFLRQRTLIHFKKGKALTKNVYLKIETVLRNYVRFHKLNLAVFDLAVWYYMRNL